MKRLAALAAGCALICAQPSIAAPFTVDHLLALEQLGPVTVDPSQRWAVIQTFGAWDTAPRFDLDDFSRYGVGKVRVFDLRAGAEQRLELPAGAGYVAGPVSPDGRRMALCRLVGRDWELGVVDLASGTPIWLGVTPELAVWGRTIVWRNDATLLAAVRDPTAPANGLASAWRAHERLTEQWAASARGEPAFTQLGSGRYRSLRAKPKPGAVLAFDLSGKAPVARPQTLARGEILDLELAPGARHAAVIVAGEDLQPLDAAASTNGTASRRRRLLLIDLATGASHEPCPDCDLISRFLAWSPDGRALLIFARDTPGAWESGAYRLVEASDGKVETLKPQEPVAFDTAGDNAPVARGGWLDGAPILRLRAAPGARADLYQLRGGRAVNLTAALPQAPSVEAASAHEWLLTAGGQVWSLKASGLRPTGRASAALVRLTPAPEGERAAFAPPTIGEMGLRRGDEKASALSSWPGRPLASPPTSTVLAAAAPRRRAALAIAKDEHGTQNVLLLKPDGAEQRLVQVNTALQAVDFVSPTTVAHQGVDGESLTSWLYLPRGTAAKRPAPVVILPYPGESLPRPPASQAPPAARLVTNAQILAARGYAVLIPSLPYRQDREPMDGLADQMLAALDAAAVHHPIAADRAAIWGHSYGGYAAVAAATQTARFKAIIASAATTNLVSAYGRLGPAANVAPELGNWIVASTGWLETGQARMGVPPWRDPERYLRNSPLMFADRITAPVLMLYGDDDKDLSQPQGLFAALYRQNRDAVLVTYRGEGHVVSSPGNVRDQYDRIFSWLGETIGPGVAPP